MSPAEGSAAQRASAVAARVRQRLIGVLPVAALFGVSGIWWIALIPLDQAPDEWTHYHYNVRFILEQGRLPVSGVDDAMAYATTRWNPYGLASARFSYAFLPQLNYVVAAGFARVGGLIGLDPWRGARLASLSWGVVFLAFTYLGCRRLGARRQISAAATAAVALLPQVVFVSSYVNRDAHSLAASAVVAWAAVAWRQDGRRRQVVALGVGVGLLLTAQLFYLLYLPALAVGALTAARSPRFGARRAAAAAAGATGVALLVSGWSYLRNLILYGDPLGISFALRTMAFHVPLGEPRPVRLDSLAWLLERGFLRQTFNSLVGHFGYLDVALPEKAYLTLAVVWTMLCALFVVELARSGDRPLRRRAAAVGMLLAGLLAAQTWSSLTVDFQPQGRYLFPILVPTALLLARAARDLRRPRWILAALAATVLAALLQAHLTLLGAYVGGRGEPTSARLGASLATEPASPSLLGGTVITQSFLSPESGLRGLWLYPAVDRIDEPVRVELRDAAGETLRRVYIAPEGSRIGPDPRSLVFHPLSESRGRRYVVAIASTASRPRAPLRLRFHAGDAVPDGEAALDGKPLAADLRFDLIY